MLKIALIRIIKDPSINEVNELHRCLDIKTASVYEIPVQDRLFSVIEDPTIVLYCLRVDDRMGMNLSPCLIEGHDAVVYAELHSHKSLS